MSITSTTIFNSNIHHVPRLQPIESFGNTQDSLDISTHGSSLALLSNRVKLQYNKSQFSSSPASIDGIKIDKSRHSTNFSKLTRPMKPKTTSEGNPNALVTQRTLPSLETKDMVLSIISMTTDEKLAYMLGKDTKNLKPLFDRPDVCAICGTEHGNPDLMDTYLYCRNCYCELREPFSLQRRFQSIPMRDPLEILFATYGHSQIPSLARDVTELIRNKVFAYFRHDRLSLPKNMILSDILGLDLSFINQDSKGKGYNQLRIRYRMNNVYGSLIVHTSQSSRVLTPISLIVPQVRYLRIKKASYGYPKGKSSTGAMSHDVTEIIQGFADLQGGSFISLSSQTCLSNILMDPCPGYSKDLMISYEIQGRSGRIERDVLHGRLKQSIFLDETIVVQPVVIVESAIYGMPESMRLSRLKTAEAELTYINFLENRKANGIQLLEKEEDHIRKNKNRVLQDLERYLNIPSIHIDVTKKFQKIIDISGISCILTASNFDANTTFGNPIPGHLKVLEVYLRCLGHDSEKQTITSDMSTLGYPRNYIQAKSAHFIVDVKDDERGHGILFDPIEFKTSFVSPCVEITKASYGLLDESNYEAINFMDVTSIIQSKISTSQLIINKGEDMNEYFSKDPFPGKPKKLLIDFITKGVIGSVRVKVKDEFVVAGIQIGYLPKPPREDQ